MEVRFTVPPVGRVNKVLLIALASLLVLSGLLENTVGLSLTGLLGLSAARFFEGSLYRLVTYPLAPQGLAGALFDGLVLWFIGGHFESSWGERRYLSFITCSSVGGGLIFLILGALFFGGSQQLSAYPLGGFTGVCSALCLAYATVYPDRILTFMLLFPMKAKYFCMILIGIELYQGLFSPFAIASWGHLGTMLAGFLTMVYFARRKLKHPSIIGRLGGLRKKRRGDPGRRRGSGPEVLPITDQPVTQCAIDAVAVGLYALRPNKP